MHTTHACVFHYHWTFRRFVRPWNLTHGFSEKVWKRLQRKIGAFLLKKKSRQPSHLTLHFDPWTSAFSCSIKIEIPKLFHWWEKIWFGCWNVLKFYILSWIEIGENCVKPCKTVFKLLFSFNVSRVLAETVSQRDIKYLVPLSQRLGKTSRSSWFDSMLLLRQYSLPLDFIFCSFWILHNGIEYAVRPAINSAGQVPVGFDAESRAKLGRDQTKSNKIKRNRGLNLASHGYARAWSFCTWSRRNWSPDFRSLRAARSLDAIKQNQTRSREIEA